jgi:hypothetical protein
MSEALDRPLDPETGVFTVRLTASALHSINIYCEQPYTSPDGRRIAIMRSADADPRMPPFELLVVDLVTYRILSLEKDVRSIFVGTSSWSGWIYYVSASGDLMAVDLTTLQKKACFARWPFPPDFVLQSVSADLRYLVGVRSTPDFISEIIRVDLAERTWKCIYRHEELLGHLQFNPVKGGGNDLLVQMNRGIGYNHMGDSRPVENKLGGATHFIIDQDGGNVRPLAIGEPYTSGTAGHAAWAADTGRVGIATHWDAAKNTFDPRWPEGNFFTVGPADKKPICFRAPEHKFNHVNVSRCGRYFVCDSYSQIPGPIQIVIGNIQTGKYRTLLPDCKANGGGPACGHPHAYFTADNKHVIYNADPYWIGQVFFARVPEGFLASLD